MDQLISFFVDGIIVPVTSVIPWLVSTGILFALFALIWIGFGVGLIWSQGSLDAAWAWLRDLPLVVQAVVWVLFLPVTVGLWIWETTWPFVIRLVLILGLAWWSLMIFLPKWVTAARP